MTRPDGDGSLTAEGQLQQVNAVFGLLLIVSQAASPAGAMRLVTTAIPAIAAGHTAAAWHPSTSGAYSEQAPEHLGPALARLTGPGRLDVDGPSVCWAFPLTAALGREPVFLVTTGPRDLSQQSIYLLSVLAQICGTVVANHELSADAELRAQAGRERDI